MDNRITAILGIVFLALSFVATFLMFQFWGYPYDKDRRHSECPRWKMNIHRGVGFAYVAVYIALMTQMVPRLWTYQIEFPPRTVAHIMLGFTIGVLLLVKLSILRWFRHFEEWMPALGVGLLLCTVLLSGLSLPFSLQERALAASAAGGSAFSQVNRERVKAQLSKLELPAGQTAELLSEAKSLRQGRELLLSECVYCHDLKTVISKPRAPADWLRTVQRMAEKPTLGDVIEENEQGLVTAYLVAITPDLQRSSKQLREREEQREARELAVMEGSQTEAAPAAPLETASSKPKPKKPEATSTEPVSPPPSSEPATATPRAAPAVGSGDAAQSPAKGPPAPVPPAIDPVKAKAVFGEVCSQCHPTSDVDGDPPRTRKQVKALILRMIENGLEASKSELSMVEWYLIDKYVK